MTVVQTQPFSLREYVLTGTGEMALGGPQGVHGDPYAQRELRQYEIWRHRRKANEVMIRWEDGTWTDASGPMHVVRGHDGEWRSVGRAPAEAEKVVPLGSVRRRHPTPRQLEMEQPGEVQCVTRIKGLFDE